ncbi:MAG: 23S rRNA (pseudouridine(1915)-N(3))-methyltransferase RlmH [Desulfobacteraceae bacterium]|jgi:23S rRNA (pseudouridine1915-N3)-methyltransferase
MFKIRVIVLDRTRSPFLKEGESFYLKRLQKYAHVDWVEVKPGKVRKGRSPEEILNAEGQAIARRLAPKDYLISLDRSGDQYDSEELAKWLEASSARVGGWICFVIGGPLGLSRQLLERANTVLSLSRFTLTHEMSRLILLEQLYRAFTIIRGEKYHK